MSLSIMTDCHVETLEKFLEDKPDLKEKVLELRFSDVKEKRGKVSDGLRYVEEMRRFLDSVREETTKWHNANARFNLFAESVREANQLGNKLVYNMV